MSLDTLANISDILSVFIGIFGVLLIIRQLKLSLKENENIHQRRQNEMTLNAYNSVKGDLRDTIRRVRAKLELEDMFDNFTQKHLEQIINDQTLRNDVDRMLSFLNKFSVGIKYDVFNIKLVDDLAGHLFIETFKQFKPYIDWVRDKNGITYYREYENLVNRLKDIKRFNSDY